MYSSEKAEQFVVRPVSEEGSLRIHRVPILADIPDGPWISRPFSTPHFFLPPVCNEFTGRVDEIRKIYTKLIEPGKQKFLCVYGPGGIGKTECVKAAGRYILDRGVYKHGVWFVDLDLLNHIDQSDERNCTLAKLVSLTMRLNIQSTDNIPPADKLATTLDQAKISALIILDGVDSLDPVDPNHPNSVPTLIQKILSVCGDRISILATSTESMQQMSAYNHTSIQLDPLPPPLAERGLDIRNKNNNQTIGEGKILKGIKYTQLFLYVRIAGIPKPTQRILEQLRKEPQWQTFKNDLQQYFCECTGCYRRLLSEDDLKAIRTRLVETHAHQKGVLDSFYFWWLSFGELVKRTRHRWEDGTLYGLLPGPKAAELLKDKEKGTFLLRVSQNHVGCLAITYVDPNKQVSHTLIQLQDDGFDIQVEAGRTIRYRTLDELILALPALTTLYPNRPKLEVLFGTSQIAETPP